jgi:hypothetical protein
VIRPRVFRFEQHDEPLLPLARFWARLVRGVAIGAILILGSLMIGVAGYHWIAGLAWVDAILNASMILTGMGPVDRLETTAAKLFASVYAIFSGVAFLTSVGVLLAPVVHRFLHRFHIGDEDSGS